MSMTKVMQISNAFALIGKGQVTALDNVSPLVQQAENAYDMLFAQEFATGFWRFATKIVQLSQVDASPPVACWQYIYQLPNDFVKQVRQYPHNYAYEYYSGGQMYSNWNGPLFMEYIFVPEPTDCPIYFAMMMSYLVAEYLALSNAQFAQYSQKLGTDAQMMRAKALAADAQNRPQTFLASAPAISQRFVSQFVSG